MTISGLKETYEILAEADVIGENTRGNIVALLNRVEASGDRSAVWMLIDVIDDLLGEIERARSVSDSVIERLNELKSEL